MVTGSKSNGPKVDHCITSTGASAFVIATFGCLFRCLNNNHGIMAKSNVQYGQVKLNQSVFHLQGFPEAKHPDVEDRWLSRAEKRRVELEYLLIDQGGANSTSLSNSLGTLELVSSVYSTVLCHIDLGSVSLACCTPSKPCRVKLLNSLETGRNWISDDD